MLCFSLIYKIDNYLLHCILVRNSRIHLWTRYKKVHRAVSLFLFVHIMWYYYIFYGSLCLAKTVFNGIAWQIVSELRRVCRTPSSWIFTCGLQWSLFSVLIHTWLGNFACGFFSFQLKKSCSQLCLMRFHRWERRFKEGKQNHLLQTCNLEKKDTKEDRRREVEPADAHSNCMGDGGGSTCRRSRWY